MKCAIDYSVGEFTIYKVFGDGSLRAICRVYEDKNFLHLDVTADNWKYLNELEEAYALFDSDMVGVTVPILYGWLVDRGMDEL